MTGRIRWTAVWAVVGVTACGSTRIGGSRARGGDGEDGGSVHPVGGVCPSASWADRNAPVAVAFEGLRLVALDGNGARRVLHSFTVPGGVREGTAGKQITVEPGRITAVVAWSFLDEGNTEPVRAGGESVRLDASGALLWRIEGSVNAPSDAGAIATIDGAQRLARSDGTISELPQPMASWTRTSFIPSRDSSGWLLMIGSVGEDPLGEPKVGLVNVDGKRFVELPAMATGVRSFRAMDGKFVYMSADTSWSLTFAGENGVRTVDLGIPLGKYDSLDLVGWGSRSLVVYRGEPIFRVDPAAEAVVPMDSSAIASAVEARAGAGSPVSYASGNWVLAAVHDDPVWLANAETGTVETIALERLLPLRRLDAGYCGNATFPDGGLIGMGLRDDRVAGFYVGHPDGADWTRVGRPYRDVIEINGRRVADTWILSSTTGENTYCPGFTPFDPDPSGDVIVGAAVQIVPPGHRPVVFPVDQKSPVGSFDLDPTGFCALRSSYDGAIPPFLFDLVTGDTLDVSDLEDFAWVQ